MIGLRPVAAGALASAATVLLPPAPASAAVCGTSTGVTVVVDFTELGGGIATTCVADGGGDPASTTFEVHHNLTRTAQYYQVVCRVDDTPADAPCQQMPPANAYWGLFWSDGDGGWTYASQSVDTLRVPDGGSVAFAWQDGGGTEQPGVAPPQHAAQPSESTSPSGSSGGSGGGAGSDSSAGSGGTAGSSSTPSQSPTAGTAASPSAESASGDAGQATGHGDRSRVGSDEGGGKVDQGDERGREKGEKRGKGGEEEPVDESSASDDPSDAVPVADPPDASGSSLPGWVAPAGIVGLFSVAGVAAYLRRRAA